MAAFLLSTIQNSARARAHARVASSVLSTIEKAARPSASLKGRRNFKFSFWNYMAARLGLRSGGGGAGAAVVADGGAGVGARVGALTGFRRSASVLV